MYTHHGQQLEMPDYIGTDITSATQDAEDRTFQIIVNDSVHIVGKEGGLIQYQNPPGNSLVKEGRKIYVTTTRYKADKIPLDGMTLYGQSFEMKKAALERKGLKTKIRDYRYDALTNNAILEMWQGDKLLVSRSKDTDGLTLEKGSVVEFILSSPEGGSTTIMDCLGKTVSTARFMHPNLRLEIENQGEFDTNNLEKAIITSQSPEADGLSSLPHGSSIRVVVKAP